MHNYLRTLIVRELSEGTATGYDLIKNLEMETGKRPSAGSIYPLLTELLEAGIVEQTQQGRRKIYSLTEKGKNHYEQDIYKDYVEIRRNLHILRAKNKKKAQQAKQRSLVFYESINKEHRELQKALEEHARKSLTPEKEAHIKNVLEEARAKILNPSS